MVKEQAPKPEAGQGQSRVVFGSLWATGKRPVTGLHNNRSPLGKTWPICLSSAHLGLCGLPPASWPGRVQELWGRGLFSALWAWQVVSN